MVMVINCATCSLFLKPSEKSFSPSLKKTPFLRFSLAATSSKSSIQFNKVSRIFCQEKTAVVPAGQQWMFDDITGPGNGKTACSPYQLDERERESFRQSIVMETKPSSFSDVVPNMHLAGFGRN